MDRFVPFSKVREGQQLLHDGRLQPVEAVRKDKLYTSIWLPDTIVQRPVDWLAPVRVPSKPRSRKTCPPLTARLDPDTRAWVEQTSASQGIAPQVLLAVAVMEYKASKEVPVAPPARRWWRRKKAA